MRSRRCDVAKLVVDNCAFLPCDQVAQCAMVGGCITKRFPRQGASTVTKETVKKGAKAENGTKPSRLKRR